MYKLLSIRLPVLVAIGTGIFLASPSLPAQDEDANEELIQAIAEFVKDADRDIRALAMQQIREEVPGEAATKQFAALLAELSPEAQADLLDALGDRGDAAARESIVARLKGDPELVRAAALRAPGKLGSASDVPLLAAQLAAESESLRNAARQSLIRLRGDDVDKTIVAAMGEADEEVTVELLAALAARNAKVAIPSVLQCAKDEELAVRVAAVDALRFLADDKNTTELVALVKEARDEGERRAVELALLSLCSRSREACAEAVAGGLKDAGPEASLALLRSIALRGGPKALESVVAKLGNENDSVHAAALRMLADWPEAAALDHLLRIANESDNTRDHVLALRGIVRFAKPTADHEADLALLETALKVAQRPQEKQLVIGVLGTIGSEAALNLVLTQIKDSELREAAALAVTTIAERMPAEQKGKAQSALKGVAKQLKNPIVKDRVNKLFGE